MINKQKGTYDLSGDKAREFISLRNFIQEFIEKYNFSYIETPVFESSDLFHRSVGETTDIVTKETYDFTDRGNRNLTLRPEGTASIVRSYIENKEYKDEIKKYYYLGRMYRYERPQSGRFREFFQFGCELFGSNKPVSDAELISIPVTFLKILGLKNIKVNLNSLGNSASREKYTKELVKYIKPNIDKLCEDCKERLDKNPLRILDCKVDQDNEILKKAPKIIDYLDKDSKDYFDLVCKYLDALQIEYVVNSNIVRGLDYYTGVVFEIEAEVAGKQSVICAGGRYDNLVKDLGGPEVPAIGFAFGIERLLDALKEENITLVDKDSVDCFIAPASPNEKEFALALTASLRMLGIKCEMDLLSKSIKNNFKQAEKFNSKLIIIVGEDEIKKNYLTIKNLSTKEEFKVKNEEVLTFLDDVLAGDMMHECSSDDCSCNDECECNDDCTCDENHKCSDKCTCGDDCDCSDKCNCGEECTCNKDHKCNPNCKCGEEKYGKQ